MRKYDKFVSSALLGAISVSSSGILGVSAEDKDLNGREVTGTGSSFFQRGKSKGALSWVNSGDIFYLIPPMILLALALNDWVKGGKDVQSGETSSSEPDNQGDDLINPDKSKDSSDVPSKTENDKSANKDEKNNQGDDLINPDKSKDSSDVPSGTKSDRLVSKNKSGKEQAFEFLKEAYLKYSPSFADFIDNNGGYVLGKDRLDSMLAKYKELCSLLDEFASKNPSLYNALFAPVNPLAFIRVVQQVVASSSEFVQRVKDSFVDPELVKDLFKALDLLKEYGWPEMEKAFNLWKEYGWPEMEKAFNLLKEYGWPETSVQQIIPVLVYCYSGKLSVIAYIIERAISNGMKDREFMKKFSEAFKRPFTSLDFFYIFLLGRWYLTSRLLVASILSVDKVNDWLSDFSNSDVAVELKKWLSDFSNSDVAVKLKEWLSDFSNSDLAVKLKEWFPDFSNSDLAVKLKEWFPDPPTFDKVITALFMFVPLIRLIGRASSYVSKSVLEGVYSSSLLKPFMSILGRMPWVQDLSRFLVALARKDFASAAVLGTTVKYGLLSYYGPLGYAAATAVDDVWKNGKSGLAKNALYAALGYFGNPYLAVSTKLLVDTWSAVRSIGSVKNPLEEYDSKNLEDAIKYCEKKGYSLEAFEKLSDLVSYLQLRNRDVAVMKKAGEKKDTTGKVSPFTAQEQMLNKVVACYGRCLLKLIDGGDAQRDNALKLLDKITEQGLFWAVMFRDTKDGSKPSDMTWRALSPFLLYNLDDGLVRPNKYAAVLGWLVNVPQDSGMADRAKKLLQAVLDFLSDPKNEALGGKLFEALLTACDSRGDRDAGLTQLRRALSLAEDANEDKVKATLLPLFEQLFQGKEKLIEGRIAILDDKIVQIDKKSVIDEKIVRLRLYVNGKRGSKGRIVDGLQDDDRLKFEKEVQRDKLDSDIEKDELEILGLEAEKGKISGDKKIADEWEKAFENVRSLSLDKLDSSPK